MLLKNFLKSSAFVEAKRLKTSASMNRGTKLGCIDPFVGVFLKSFKKQVDQFLQVRRRFADGCLGFGFHRRGRRRRRRRRR